MPRSFLVVAFVTALPLALAPACTPAKPERRDSPTPIALDPTVDASSDALATGARTAPPASATSFAPAPDAGAAGGAAPSKPASLTATAVSPFAVRLAWEADAKGAAGFELQIKVKEAFVRAALVDPTKREFVHHMRLPRQVLTYRVRAFNAQGASEPSPAATLTMPERLDVPGAKALAMGPCVTMPAKPPKSSGCDPEISSLDAGTGHVVFNVPGAGDGCARHLMGEVAGCTRELGVFTLQADLVIVQGHTDDGWPLLHAIAGAGQYVGAQIQTLRFSRGRYAIVDEAHVCGETDPSGSYPSMGIVNDDLERCSPPFETCQRDPTPL